MSEILQQPAYGGEKTAHQVIDELRQQVADLTEAVRVLGAWKRADISCRVASKEHTDGQSGPTFDKLDAAMNRLVAAENAVNANPIAAAAVKGP